MTEGAHFLAVKPLSVKTTRASCADAVILNVMRHNARELQAEIGVGADSGIDASRIHLNVTLHGPATADGVASAARDAMREHGIVAPRKNATLGIEIVASLPAGLLIDHLAYFRDTAAWAQRHYRVPLLSAIVHNDESSPHLHLVLLPVRDGKLVGSELLGNRATMKAMQKDFHEQVAKQYGLRMPAAKKRHSAAQRAAGIALLRETLQANSGLTEEAIEALLVPHTRNPEPLLVALGLAMPAPVVKGSFVATMTRKVRPEGPGRTYKKSPIGHLRAQTADGFLPENENSYALLGDCISTPNFPPSANPSSASNSAPGQQASSSPATSQSTTDQQRERSTTGAAVPPPGQQGSDEMDSQCTAGDILSFEGIPEAGELCTVVAPLLDAGRRQASTGVQNILHTPLVVGTNPASNLTASASTSPAPAPRKRATKPPVAAAGRPAAKRAAGTALSVGHGEQHEQLPAQQQAGQHPGAPVHASVRTPDSFLRGDAGPVGAATVPARATTKGQNLTAPLAISQPVDNPATLPDWAIAPRTTASPGKTGMALSTVGSTVEALAAERSQHHARQQVGQQSDHDAGLASAAPTKRTATKRQAKTVTAAPARPTGTTPKRKRTTAKVASTTSTTSTPATAHHQAASIEQTTASQAGQVATAKMRKRTSKMAASTSPSPRTSAAGIAPAADQVDTQTAKPALQQAGHQQDQQHRAHAMEEQAAPGGRPQTGNAGIEVTVDTPAKRSTAKGIVPANDTRAGQPAVSAAAPACLHLASNDDVTPRNAKASQAASARRDRTSTATPASAPAAPRAGKRSSTASRPAATPLTPSISTRSTSSTAAPSTSTSKPKRTATLQQANGTPAPDTLPGKAAPVPATPTKRMATSRKDSGAASSKPALGKGQYDASADQPDEIRRLADDARAAATCVRSNSYAAPTGVKQGNCQNHRRANQPNEIRTLGLAPRTSMSGVSTAPATRDALKLEPISPVSTSAVRSPEYSGQLQVDQQASRRAGEDDRHGAPGLDQLPMPAPRINDSATARPAAQAGIAAHFRHQSPAPVIEQGLLQGGASTDTDLGPRQGEQLSTTAKPAAPGIEQHQQPAHAQRAAGIKGRLQGRAFDGTDLTQHHQHGLAPLSNADDYERVSDDAQAAELWDGDLGEFVKAPAKATRCDARTPAGPTLATWSTYCMRLDLRR